MTNQTLQDRAIQVLPSPSDDDAWTGELVCDIAQVPPCQSVAELIDTYGTADPGELRARYALPDDIAAAERFATEAQQVAA